MIAYGSDGDPQRTRCSTELDNGGERKLHVGAPVAQRRQEESDGNFLVSLPVYCPIPRELGRNAFLIELNLVFKPEDRRTWKGAGGEGIA